MLFDFDFSFPARRNPTTLTYAVPGWGSEDLTAEIVGDRTLSIKGEKDGRKFAWSERFPAPLDPAKVTVQVKHGVLTINVGYQESGRQTIPVT